MCFLLSEMRNEILAMPINKFTEAINRNSGGRLTDKQSSVRFIRASSGRSQCQAPDLVLYEGVIAVLSG